MIAHSKPTLDQDDYRSILDVLKSGQIVQGEQVAGFEDALSSFVGVKTGIAVSSPLLPLEQARGMRSLSRVMSAPPFSMRSCMLMPFLLLPI